MLDRKASRKANNASIDHATQTSTDKRIRLIDYRLHHIDSKNGPFLPESSLPHFTFPIKRWFLPNQFTLLRIVEVRYLLAHLDLTKTPFVDSRNPSIGRLNELINSPCTSSELSHMTGFQE